jgi:hypothetical protein
LFEGHSTRRPMAEAEKHRPSRAAIISRPSKGQRVLFRHADRLLLSLTAETA